MVGVRTEEETVAISVAGGHVLKTSTDQEDEDEALAITLIESELLSRERMVRIADHVDQTGESLARSLFSLQVMTAREVVRAMKAMHNRHLRIAMDAKEATFTFARSDVLAGKGVQQGATSVRIRRALNDYLRQRLKTVYHTDLESMLQPLRDLYLRVPDSVQKVAGALGFQKREQHTMESLLDGSHKLDEILRQSVMSKNGAARAMFQMTCLGFVETLEESSRPRVVISDAQKLETTLQQLERSDLFDRLGAHWTTPSLQIRTAYERRQKDYGEGGRYRKDAETSAVCDRIQALMKDAWATLQNTEARRRYRATLVEDDQVRFSADLLFAQAQTAELQTEFDRAREMYETAMELYPNPKAQRALTALDARQAAWRQRMREKEILGEL